MATNSSMISQIYILAGLYNFSILIFCKFFQKDIGQVDDLFNTNGIISIILWGMAYISISNKYEKLSYTNFVFFVEKLFYFIKWLNWISSNTESLQLMLKNDQLNFIFFSIYGVGDILFGLFFLIIGLKFLHHQKQDKEIKDS